MKDVQPKPKTDQEVGKEFLDAYNDICKKYNYNIISTPVWMRRDDNTFSLVIQQSVGKRPKQV